MFLLSLVALLFVDAAALTDGRNQVVRVSIPASAILLPMAYPAVTLGEPGTASARAWYPGGQISLVVALVGLGAGCCGVDGKKG